MKIITTHKGSDFDALASLVAAKLVYPDARPVLPGSINANLKSFLSIHKDLFDLYSPKDINLDTVDTLIVVDTHSWTRLDQRLSPQNDRRDLPRLESVLRHVLLGEHGESRTLRRRCHGRAHSLSRG